jgi:hypothetical protein
LIHVQNLWAALTLAVTILSPLANAQIDQVLPEIDFTYKLTSVLRATFQAKWTREGGETASAEIGPSIELYLKPLVKLKNVTAFDLDDAKSRPLVFSIGYRDLTSPSSPSVNRMEPTVTFHFPAARFLLTDKNRGDLDWTDGNFSWRYRNRVQIEKRLTVRRYHPAAYASAEFFYQSKYQKWSDTALYAGCLFPMRTRFEFDTYFEHQNDTGKRPNQRLNQLGLKLLIDLSRNR